MAMVDGCGSAEQNGLGLRPAHWQQELFAHCLCMDAQAAVAQQDWDRADTQLAKVSKATAKMLLCLQLRSWLTFYI